ncbi:MAG TPA: transglycosylase SLT domain-containing protein [Thermoanaerobaculia bacterium]|nr:transglycosylase SLT domain-containing protein [Thermoanaerobaculia bacterium]
MNNVRRLLPAAALLIAACATTARPPAPQAAGRGPRASDAAALRLDLQKTYDEIVALEHKPLKAPLVDLEAAASIPIPGHRSIRAALNLFTTEMRDDIQTSLIRSARYKKTIDAALREYRLPKGLAYLPVIESAYLPLLTSRAGAHGIWQFMPDTAREYGLRVDWWVDERADPALSARAAASYLSDLYRQFNDWPLVLAAYNAGPGRIHRAMQSTGATTFWELLDEAAIPKETRGYVPTFYATLLIASDPETYGFRLGTPEDDDEQEVTVEGPLSLTYVADVTGVDHDLLRQMNPALRYGLLPPGRSVLRVPQKVAEVVASRAATMKKDDANIAVCSFTLRENDSVRKLAEALGTRPETILAMNALRSAKSVGEGDAIYLPVRARELGTLLAHYNDAKVYYKVRKGDTFYSVARKHGLSVEELRDLNDLNRRARLHPGERLRVYKPRVVLAGGM